MATENEIKIIVDAEVSKALKDFKKVTKGGEKLEKGTKKTNKALKQQEVQAKKTGGMFGKLKAGYLAAAAGLAGLLAGAAKSLKLFAQQEKAENTLAAAMKQAGTFTEEAFKANLKYASSLQKLTVFGDENILMVQKQLTNFGFEGQALKDLTKATLDLASAKGMDLASAGDLVAKSVGSSTNALTRYGIQVTGAAGSTERANEAVKNITKLFGGAAAAEANTFGGKIKQLSNTWGDFLETIGGKLAPAVSGLADFFSDLIGPQTTNKELTSDLITLNKEYQTALKAVNDELDNNTTELQENNAEKVAENTVKIIKNTKELKKNFDQAASSLDELGSFLKRDNPLEILEKLSGKNFAEVIGVGLRKEKDVLDINKRELLIISKNLKAKEAVATISRDSVGTEREGLVVTSKRLPIAQAREKILNNIEFLEKKIAKTQEQFNTPAKKSLDIINGIATAFSQSKDTTLFESLLGDNPRLLALIKKRAKQIRETTATEIKKPRKKKKVKDDKTNPEIEELKKAIELGLSLREDAEEKELENTAEFIEKRFNLLKKAGFTEAQANEAINNLIAEQDKRARDKRIANIKEVLKVASDTLTAVSGLTNAVFARQLDDIDKQRETALEGQNQFRMQIAALDEQDKMQNQLDLQQELERAKIAGDEKLAFDKEKQLERIKLEEEAKKREEKINAEFDAKEREAKNKQARADKAFNVFQATLALGQAVASAFAYTKAGPTVKSISSGIAAGIAAANLAAVAATPVPRFLGGIDFVPRDRMPALLDEGERVLTKEENNNFNNSFDGNIVIQGVSNPEEFAGQLNDYLKSRGAVNVL